MMAALHTLGFPGIPTPITDFFEGLASIANPFEFFSKSMQGIYKLMVVYFEQVVTSPPRVQGGGVIDYAYGNAIGLSGSIALVVTVVVMCAAIFHARKALSAAEAIVIAVFIGVAGPFVYGLADTMMDIGDQLSKVAMFYHSTSNGGGLLATGLDGVASMSPILTMFAFMPIVTLGAANMFVVFIYEALSVFLKIAVLPALAMRPLGDKYKRFSNWTISAAVVAMMLGRPAMVLCVEIGQMAGDNIVGGSVVSSAFFLTAGLAMSLWVQKKLYTQAQSIVGKVMGRTVSRVTGRVESTLKNKRMPPAGAISKSHAGTMSPMPVKVVAASNPQTRRQRAMALATTAAKTEVRRRVVAAVAAKATTVAAGSNPGTAAALIARQVLAQTKKGGGKAS
jgi:hypothetical protein